MKLTDKHVSDETLNLWVEWYSEVNPDPEMASALLELKQRRAEDRQREAVNGRRSD
jgi:hypothetical protein